MTLTKQNILDNHMYVICSFGISTKEELNFPSMYWIPNNQVSLPVVPINNGILLHETSF